MTATRGAARRVATLALAAALLALALVAAPGTVVPGTVVPGAAAPAAAAEAPGRDPVVFVHGLFGSPSNFSTMRFGFLFAGYWATPMVSFGYDSTGSMEAAAQQLAAEVDAMVERSGADRVDVVTHSLGGLPSRWFVKFLGGTASVDDWVSLGGPNQGGAPGTCPAPGSAACRDATQGSAFLARLNGGDQTPGDVSYTTFASPCDTVVDPSWTPVDGGTNLTTGCVSHVALVNDGTVRQRVLEALAN